MSRRNFFNSVEFDKGNYNREWYLNNSVIRSACQSFKKQLFGRQSNFELLVSFDKRDCIINNCDASVGKDSAGYIIKIDPDLSFKDFYTALAHEFVHIAQDWKGKASFDLYRGIANRSPDFDELSNHEIEAYELEEQLFGRWLEETSYPDVKERIDKELI